MKVQQIQQINTEQKKTPKFKGGADAFLRYLATNQAIGANTVDVAFMVLPRTTTDLVNRGPAAGLETGRREASGTANHTLIGLYGALSGAVIAAFMRLKNAFGIKANSLFTAPETLNVLAENKAHQLKEGLTQLDYLKRTLSNIKAFNPTLDGAKEGYVKLSNNTINEIANILDKSLNDNVPFKTFKDVKSNNSLQVIVNKIVSETGAESQYILESADKKISSQAGLKTLLEDIFKVSESFNKEKVVEAFKNQIKEGKPVNENIVVSKLQKFMKNRAIAGFAIGSAIGMSIQPLNIYLTKKKTGSDGFVGVEGRSKDNSTGFKFLKLGAGAGFFGLTLATLKTGFKGFMDKMAFKNFWPTLDQLKGIYGLTIISRLLAARDKDELRESLTKDFLGYLSWLVLGDFVNRITAEIADKNITSKYANKSVLNRTDDISKKSFIKRVFNSTLKTRDEILIKELAENGIETIKKDGEKVVAKNFKELMKDLDRLPEEVKKLTKKRLRVLNIAQLSGYLFSGFVLGLGIPNLNIYITNTLDKKRKAKLAEQAQISKA